ncbi:MAG: malate/quinone oxidoreductase [Akkermansiaceae bacterium]|nr:malate/quinone oxidoreductase [Akkermansiaceae bacterium]
MTRVDTFAEPDVVLIGGGIMSATLGVLLHQLDPSLKIQVVEALAEVAKESSNPWNNAGTGHAALCELNYTKENADGSVDISKAVEINEAFEVSKQFWAHLVETGVLPAPREFITPVPHMSFVHGAEDQDYLRRRYQTMSRHHFFADMEYTEDRAKLQEWAPLLLAGRHDAEPLAATHADAGTDVNFGALTRSLVDFLASKDVVKIATQHLVKNIRRKKDGRWELTVRNMDKGINRSITAPFVFVGAGGASLPLLQKSKIPEGKGFGGFPVSGQFLVCDNPEIVDRHNAKVYGKAAVGAPPMSVPHLDTRLIDGKHTLLFGPFAGFSPKFLKSGSVFDLPGSVKLSNLVPMLAVGKDNLDLTRYLIEQVMQSPEDRLDALREFFPGAQLGDWKLLTAGQRVQIIKQHPEKGGVLQFGTEVVSATDGSIAALLGASPGASTAVDVMLDIIGKCFASRLPEWRAELERMIPSYGKSLKQDPALYTRLKTHTDAVLQLKA